MNRPDSIVPPATSSDPASEALATSLHEVLTDHARKRFGKIPVELVVDLVVRTTRQGDFAVSKAAIEALGRRHNFFKRDGLVVKSAPKKSALGLYRVGRSPKEKQARTYEVELVALSPLITSCDCPDFVRSSLGLCKHGLAVLHKLSAGKRLGGRPSARRRSKPRLRWDPVHPLTGPADRLARLWLDEGGAEGKPASPKANASPRKRLAAIEQHFQAIERRDYTAEPAARRVLIEERQRAEQMARTAKAAKRSSRALSSLERRLYDYQREGVERFLARGRLLLADDMGLGKTTQAIACCHALYQTKNVTRGLVVVPAALKPQWKREWEHTTTIPLFEAQGSPDDRRQLYEQTEAGFLLLGYEQLLRDLRQLHDFAPDLILLDEAQRIKNWATKSAAYIKSFDAPYRLALTGTPMENRFEELASIMDFVDDVALEPKWRLVPWHSLDRGDGAKGLGGARNLDTLRARMDDVFVRRRRVEVLSQLPKRTDTQVPVDLTEAQLEEHEELKRPIASLMQRTKRRALTQAEFLRLMQLLARQRMVCNGLAQLQFEMEWPRCLAQEQPSEQFLKTLFSPKLLAFRDLVQQLVAAQGRKAVVFSQWRAMLRLAEWSSRDILSEAGQKSLFFTGAESSKLREKAIVEFHDDPDASVLFLSDAGGIGLNLQRAANCCINLELPWNPAVLEQRIARIYRLGQKQPIDVFNLVSTSGIEARIADLIERKQAVFSTLFDGTSEEVRFEGRSFLEGVNKLVEPVELPDEDDDADEGDSQDDVAASPQVGAAAAGDAAAGDATGGPSPERAPAHQASDERPAAKEASHSMDQLSQAMAQLSVQRTLDGGLKIEAPKELAEPMAAAFESLARALRASSE